jgi:hypothetical protein
MSKFVFGVSCLLNFIVEVVVVFVEALLAVTLFSDGECFWLDVELPERSVIGVSVLSNFGNRCSLS